MIETKNLSFRYNGARHDALADLSFQLSAGNLICLLGANGSGKSTLLGLLAGLFRPTTGTLQMKGKCVFMPQDPDAYILGSLVEEDLLLGLYAAGNRADTQTMRQKALDLAAHFGLDHLLQEPTHTLSHGQKRKLCLASALTLKPDILLLDEPFAGLDHPAALHTRETLRRNRENGITQIIAEHDLDYVADMANAFLLLHNNHMLCLGEAGEVFPLCIKAGVRPPCWWFTGGREPIWAK